MFGSDEAKAVIQFLDRCPITGHQERKVMNQLVDELIEYSQTTGKNNLKKEDK